MRRFSIWVWGFVCIQHYNEAGTEEAGSSSRDDSFPCHVRSYHRPPRQNDAVCKYNAILTVGKICTNCPSCIPQDGLSLPPPQTTIGTHSYECIVWTTQPSLINAAYNSSVSENRRQGQCLSKHIAWHTKLWSEQGVLLIFNSCFHKNIIWKLQPLS